MDIIRRDLNELSDIDVDIYTFDSKKLRYGEIMLITFKGYYRTGSAGNSDAMYMRTMGEAALIAWEPSGAILDMSQLTYKWGDKLEIVFDTGARYFYDEPFPTAVVVGPNCEEAVRTLLLGMDSKEPIESVEWVFKDLEAACNYIEQKLEEYK
ncbi:hypothetical protein [Aneurinibacillus aneurinilyticus]|uniref:hypothetical protein n=1 Tax=Aneurinibacillus aneurinilyticus TaxID=1391 RepID=UPI0023F215A0|nr:hypothetical protein [Aneurinibacillus aneurinilyticus]